MGKKLKKAISLILVFILSLAMLPAAVSGSEGNISDVKSGDWYYTAVTEMCNLGVMSPYNDGTFRPNNTITGKEVAEAMFNMMKLSLIAKETSSEVKNQIAGWNTLFDVPTNYWAYNYMRAYFNFFNKEKMAQGDKTVNRQECVIALIGARRLDYTENGRVFAKDPILYDDAPINCFADKDQVSEIYKYFTELALEKGIIQGTTENGKKYLHPTDNVTRAETAALLFNLYNSTINNFNVSTVKIGAPRITAIKREVKVGIILFDSSQFNNNQTDANPDYTLFEALDKNINKPMDWDLVNPHAPKDTAKLDYAQFKKLGIGTSDQTETRKKNFKYWEAKLSQITTDQLANDYDVLFETSHKTITLSVKDRDKIKSFIEAGGQMWWENCDGLIVNKNFVSYGFAKDSYINIPTKKRYDQVPGDTKKIHPLLDNIFKISLTSCDRTGNKCPTNSEVSRLGDLDEYSKPTTRITGYTGSSNETVVVRNVKVCDTTKILPSILCTSMGKGRLITSSNDIACGICDIVNGGGNGVEDYKFCYNLIGWMSKVAIDFNEMENSSWAQMNSNEIKDLKANVTNMGGRMQDYNLTATLPAYWSLAETHDYDDYNDAKSIYYNTVLGIDSLGYPSVIRLAPNESSPVLNYKLVVGGQLIEGKDYGIQIKAEAVGNARDSDAATYKIFVKNVGPNVFSIHYNKDENNSISNEGSPSINSFFDINVTSPLTTEDSTYPSGSYDIKLDYMGGTINQVTAELQKNDSGKILSDVGSGVAVSRSGNSITIKASDVHFTKPDQNLKVRVYLKGLADKTVYNFTGYAKSLINSKVTNIDTEDIIANFKYGKPVLSVAGTQRTTHSTVNVTVGYTAPAYTDKVNSQNRIEIYNLDSKKKIIESSKQVKVLSFTSDMLSDETGTVTFTGLSAYKSWYAKMYTTSATFAATDSPSNQICIVTAVNVN